MKANQVNWITFLLFGLALFFGCAKNAPKLDQYTEAKRKYFQETKLKAEKGDTTEQFNLSQLYEFGDGVAKDAAKAMKWLRKAAEQNDARAQIKLGDMYVKGNNVSIDILEAYAWYNLGCEQRQETEEFYNLKQLLTPQQVAEGQKRSKKLAAMIEAKMRVGK